MTAEAGKWAAARRACEFVESGMVVGLGTGSTAIKFVDLLGRRVAEEGLSVVGVPTSEATAARAREVGVPLAEGYPDFGPLDLAVDGADEVDPGGHLIKGGGGALLREKLVAAASRRFVVVVDESKHVARLGDSFRLPVEVVAFGWTSVLARLAGLGAVPELRGGGLYRTDHDNLIADCRFPGIPDPAGLDARIRSIPGVVETGLFVGMAERVITGAADGSVREWRPG